MRTFEIGFNSVPCLTAQQNGEVPTILVPLTPVIAADANAAIALVAAANADKLKKAGPTLQVIVRPVN